MRPAVLRSAVLALIALIAIVTAGLWRANVTSGQGAVAPMSPPYLVVIVMDGFRADYQRLAPMPHLHSLMARGMTYDTAWAGQLESETPSDHATIATGVYPRKHGVIGFGWRDPRTGGYTFMPTNLGQIQAGDLTQTIEQGGVPTISDLVHARNPKDVVVAVSGEKLWAAAPLGTGADYVVYGKAMKVPKGQNSFRAQVVGPNLPPKSSGYTSVSEPDAAFALQDDFAAREAVKLVTALHPRALLLNLPSTDIAGHYYGGPADPTDMRPIVKGADAAIGRIVNLYRRLGLLKRTLFVVTADHGMVAGKVRVPIHPIYRVVGHSGAAELDEELRTSLGSIWLKDPQQAGMVAKKITGGHFTGVEGVLYKVAAQGGWKFVPTPWTRAHVAPALLHAYLDLADTEASPNGADILLPYSENTTGMPVGKSFVGMHGGVSWGSQHIPLVLAGPGVRHGLSHFPVKLVDIAPTIERLVGLRIPSGVDGVVLADALTSSTDAERQAENTVAPGRDADVRVLAAHSAAQTH